MSGEMRQPRWATIAAGAVVALGVLGACGDDSGTVTSTGGGSGSASASASAPAEGSASASAPAAPHFERSQATSEADYALTDYSFQGPMTVKGPRVYVTARNEGKENHELEILNREGEAVGEIPSFAPGAAAEPLAAELPAGQYTLQCILETADGKVHKDLGMVATLTVE